MATYGDLVKDVRALVPGLSDTDVTDKTIARFVWRATITLVTEVADLNADDPRLPRSTEAPSIPSDLTTGISLPSDVLKIVFFEVQYSTNNLRDLVTLVVASSRFDSVSPTPAGYIAGTTLYPIPADGSKVWTDAQIKAGGWTDVSKVTTEYVPDPAEPTALSTTYDVDSAFERGAVYAAAADLARGYSPPIAVQYDAAYRAEKDNLFNSIGMGTRSNQRVIRGM